MKKRILIVDDSETIRKTMVLALKKYEFETVEAVDGMDGLSKLDGSKFHLIITDENMPHLNGLNMVRTIKKEKKYEPYKFIPIIMLTTESSYEMKKEGKEAGIKIWITKPFPPETLVNAISRLLV